MAADPMEFMRAARPQMPHTADIRPLSTGEINGRSLDELSTTPASPLYRSKLPPPPCLSCGEDHVPNRSYTHEYQREPAPQQQSLPQSAYVTYEEESHNTKLDFPRAADQRVGLYIGRNDRYVLIVERAPDWDGFESFKIDSGMVVPMIRLVRALGIRVSDKTGGDLAALESDASESS